MAGPAAKGDAERLRFEALLGRCERLRPGGLAFEELRELAQLYRTHLGRLARLREHDDDPDAIRHLNSLCVRAHAHLGTARPARGSSPPLLAGLPNALARTWRAQLLAWGLLALGLYLGAALVSTDPRSSYALVPSGLGYTPAVLDRLLADPAARAEFLAREETPVASNVLFGSFLFAHNTRVGLLAFATGMLAGIPTVLLALYNGLTVGALGAVFFRDPLPLPFLAWILPHAVPELTAVNLCVAGGLVLGGAIAAPGRRPRAVALREAARPALLLFVSALPLFLLAAVVESFVRESALSIGARLAIAGGMAGLVVAGLGATLRLSRRVRREASWIRELTAPVEH
ncbi:MAG: stage II sporulation protein M [Myxococcota bacterium]